MLVGQGIGVRMLNILIVEDERLFADTLKYLVELNPRYVVTDVVDAFAGAVASVERRRPDLALVDLQLANGSTGFSVAAKLTELGVPCLFTTGRAPSFPLRDLALGCLLKPFTEEDLVRALKTAEDLLRGRECLRPSRPDNLRLYDEEVAVAAPAPEPARDGGPSRRLSLWGGAGRRKAG